MHLHVHVHVHTYNIDMDDIKIMPYLIICSKSCAIRLDYTVAFEGRPRLSKQCVRKGVRACIIHNICK